MIVQPFIVAIIISLRAGFTYLTVVAESYKVSNKPGHDVNHCDKTAVLSAFSTYSSSEGPVASSMSMRAVGPLLYFWTASARAASIVRRLPHLSLGQILQRSEWKLSLLLDVCHQCTWWGVEGPQASDTLASGLWQQPAARGASGHGVPCPQQWPAGKNTWTDCLLDTSHVVGCHWCWWYKKRKKKKKKLPTQLLPSPAGSRRGSWLLFHNNWLALWCVHQWACLFR